MNDKNDWCGILKDMDAQTLEDLRYYVKNTYNRPTLVEPPSVSEEAKRYLDSIRVNEESKSEEEHEVERLIKDIESKGD